MRHKSITVYGDGKQSRCFCYVKDVVQALIGLMNNPDAMGQIYNVGSTKEITIKHLAERVKKLTQSNSEIVFIPYEQAYEFGFEDMTRRVPDTGKIQKLLDCSRG